MKKTTLSEKHKERRGKTEKVRERARETEEKTDRGTDRQRGFHLMETVCCIIVDCTPRVGNILIVYKYKTGSREETPPTRKLLFIIIYNTKNI